METEILQHYLELLNARAAKSHLVGVYASDRLPKRLNRPAALIVHTETASEKYGHWISIYVPAKGDPIYFDSFGIDIHVPNHESFISRMSKNYKFNSICYQAPTSTVCGWYTLMHLAENMGVIKKGFFKRMILRSKGDFDENDKIVEECGRGLVSLLQGEGVSQGKDKKHSAGR
jgi:hypothetical protein